MTDITAAGAFRLGDRTVNRMGYGAMQLAGPGVFGPPRDRPQAIAVLREAVASGVDHIDTSDFYGPHVTNELIREALHPYPDDLVIVTKVGARRGADASWNPALCAAPNWSARCTTTCATSASRRWTSSTCADGRRHGPSEGSIDPQFDDAGRAAAAGPDPPSRPQQRHRPPRSPRRGRSPRSSACRTSTTSSTAATTR